MADSSSFYDSIINLGIPGSVPDGITDPQVTAVYKILSAGLLNILKGVEQYGGMTPKDVTLWDSLVPSDTILISNLLRFYVTASENLLYGDLVNLYNVAGICNARKAISWDGAAPRRAHGFCNISGGATSGNRTEVILKTGLVTVSGIVPGNEVYLGSTAGLMSLTPDTTAGHLEQHVGIGVATDTVFVDINIGAFIQH